MKSLFILVILLVVTQGLVYSQNVIQSKGKSEVRLESNMTKDQAREKAEELAKINAIENAFGSYVEQQSDIRVQDGRVNYDIISGIQVRGEWIRTEKVEYNEESRSISGKEGKEQDIWVLCQVNGEVRKCIPRAKLDIITLNCPVKECRTTSYYDKEDLYLYFKSPVNGFLSIFLDDGKTAFRLLPYKSMENFKALEVSGDREYIFFSKDKSHQFDNKYPADALEVFTNKEFEYNYVYIVFAENPYIKPMLSNIKEIDDGYLLPKSLNSEDFQNWLSDCRAAMTDFQTVRIKISIEKK